MNEIEFAPENEYRVEWDGQSDVYFARSEADAREQWEADYDGDDDSITVTLVAEGALPKMEDVYDGIDIDTLIEYVEAADPFIAVGAEPTCGCDEWSVCAPCALLAERTGEILRAHGYYCTYGDGCLDTEGRDQAERLYLRYCAEVGRTPKGVIG